MRRANRCLATSWRYSTRQVQSSSSINLCVTPWHRPGSATSKTRSPFGVRTSNTRWHIPLNVRRQCTSEYKSSTKGDRVAEKNALREMRIEAILDPGAGERSLAKPRVKALRREVDQIKQRLQPLNQKLADLSDERKRLSLAVAKARQALEQDNNQM